MPYSLSNLILLFPVACSLGVAVALTGGLVERPRYDWIRTLLRICVWQMIALSLVGLLFRFTFLHILWIPIFIAFAVMLLFWNRSVTRNHIALALLATSGSRSGSVSGSTNLSTARVQLLTRYLLFQTHGYLRRLGRRLARTFEESGDWILSAYRSGLIRGARPLTALALLRTTGNSQFFKTELKAAAEQRRWHSRQLGRIVAASLSYVPLMFVNALFSPALGGSMSRLVREFRGVDETWQTSWTFWVADSGVVYWFAGPLCLLLISMYLLQIFPRLMRIPPLSWLCSRYYRAVALRGLGESIRAEPQLSTACRVTSQAVPVVAWSSRLFDVAKRIDQGELAANAMRHAHLVSSQQAHAIALCQDAESLAWTLDDLATSDLQRLNDSLSIVVQVSVVVLVLLSATIALLFTSAVFSTLANWVMEF